MSGPKLNRDDKITAILNIIRVDPEHHDHFREIFAHLSDKTVQRVYRHSLTMKQYFDRKDSE